MGVGSAISDSIYLDLGFTTHLQPLPPARLMFNFFHLDSPIRRFPLFIAFTDYEFTFQVVN
jgi:hypothetical protein